MSGAADRYADLQGQVVQRLRGEAAYARRQGVRASRRNAPGWMLLGIAADRLASQVEALVYDAYDEATQTAPAGDASGSPGATRPPGDSP